MYKVNIKRLKHGSVYAAFYSKESRAFLDLEKVGFPISDAVYAAAVLSSGYSGSIPSSIWVCWNSKTLRVFSLLGEFIDSDTLSVIESLTGISFEGSYGSPVSLSGGES